MIYDEENMLDDMLAVFKSKLNTEITAVNTEKGATAGQDLFIDAINDSNYIFQSLTKDTNNMSGFFMLYALTDTPIRDMQEGNFIEDVTMTFEIATFDDGRSNLDTRFTQLLRYRKAMKAVIRKSPDVFRGYAKSLVGSLKPAAFPYSKNVIILSIGLDIKASVTSN